MEAESGGGTGLKEQYRPAIAPVGTILPPKPGTIGYTGPETTTAPVADIAGRRQRIEDSLTRAAFGPERIREILKQLEASSFLANGGRVGMAGGGVSQGLDYLTGVKRQGYADGDIASGLAIRLNRPVQPGDPIGSYYGGTPIMISNKKVEPTLNTDNQGRLVNSITGVPLNIETTPTSLPLSGETTPTSLQFDNPERAERIEASLTRAAFGPERIREILMQLKEANYLANGGRVGYVGGGPATTQDYATALSKVGAGTQEQKNRQVQDYARSEASNQIANAIRQGGQSSLDSYLTNVFGQGTPATTSGKYASYNSPFTGIFSSTRNQMIDDVAQQLVQKQAPSFYVDPKASASEAYGKMMQQKIEEAYGTPDKYRAEAMTLGMPVEAYYDYLTTRDDKNIMQQYRKQDPYFDPSTYVPFTEADRTSSPYDIYLQQVLQQQIDAGIPEEGRIQSGEVALPSMISPTTTGAAPRPFMSYSDALAQTRQSLGLADGGLATLFSMKR
jgi:hypothetical protein